MGVEIYGSGVWECNFMGEAIYGSGNVWEWKFMGVEIYGSGNLWESAAEPAEKLPKCRLGWTRRAATKTTNIPDLLVVVVGCLRVAQRPPEGATTEIPD